MRINFLITALALILACQTAWAAGFGGQSATQDPTNLKMQALEMYADGDYEEARNLYQQAIATAEKMYGANSTFVADLCYEVGTLSLEDGSFACAEEYLSKAAQRNPNSIMTRVKYAELLMMRGKSGPALKQIQQALKRDPGSVEARQALVRWMMSQSSHGSQGAAANLASTWESYRLKMSGHNSVKRTLALINRWKNNLISPGSTPVASVAMMGSPKPKAKQEAQPKPKPKAKPKPRRSKPKAKPKPKAQPKPKAKPKPKPKKVTKPKRASKPKPPRQKAPAKKKSKKSGKKAKTRNGLVPPPPPLVPVFKAPPPPPTGFTLQTDAKLKKERNKKKPVKKKAKPKPVVPDEPDYLLDWADVGKKKKDK